MILHTFSISLIIMFDPKLNDSEYKKEDLSKKLILEFESFHGKMPFANLAY